MGQKNALKHQTECTQPYLLADQAEKLMEELYRTVQLPPELLNRLEGELQAEIVSASPPRLTFESR